MMDSATADCQPEFPNKFSRTTIIILLSFLVVLMCSCVRIPTVVTMDYYQK